MQIDQLEVLLHFPFMYHYGSYEQNPLEIIFIHLDFMKKYRMLQIPLAELPCNWQMILPEN